MNNKIIKIKKKKSQYCLSGQLSLGRPCYLFSDNEGLMFQTSKEDATHVGEHNSADGQGFIIGKDSCIFSVLSSHFLHSCNDLCVPPLPSGPKKFSISYSFTVDSFWSCGRQLTIH
jgi:hypothetical protein